MSADEPAALGLSSGMLSVSVASGAFTERFEILEELGRGSFATTFKCRDESGAIVAVKQLMVAGQDNWEPLKLFEREARVMATLDHPQIPDFHEVFESKTSDGDLAYFIVQELIEGESLADMLMRGATFTDERLVEIADDVLTVLDYIHSRRPPVLHRDIKPSNIMLPRASPAVLIDFGGVRYGWRAPSEIGATVVGTYGYMPQEQLLGQASPASDLYALGATLLHAATGRPPHELPFDTGRYELDGLTVSPAVLAFLTEVLRPAPNRRPQSASAARALLSNRTALVPVGPRELSRDDDHLSVKERATRKHGRQHVPVFVELPPPPRRLQGEHADLFKTLMNARKGIHMPLRRRWYHYVASGISSLGMLPAVDFFLRRKDRRRYRPLVRDGIYTRGVVNSADDWEIAYEFDVGGDRITGTMPLRKRLGDFFERGEMVGILYRGDDPTSNCMVFRLEDQRPHLLAQLPPPT